MFIDEKKEKEFKNFYEFDKEGSHQIIVCLNVGNLKSCWSMFSSCRRIENIKFNNIKTILVTYMSDMF